MLTKFLQARYGPYVCDVCGLISTTLVGELFTEPNLQAHRTHSEKYLRRDL